MSERLVTSSQFVAFEAVVAMDEEQRRHQSLMKLCKQSMGLLADEASGHRKPTRRAHAASGKAKPKRQAARPAGSSIDPAPAAVPPPSSSSSESSETGGELSADEYWADMLSGLRKSAARKSVASDSAECAKVQPPPIIEKSARGSRIIEQLGLATLSEIRPNGILIGFGITCKRHTDDADGPGVYCKKHFLLGKPPISHDEAKLRLKRWFVGGAHAEHGWTVGQSRTEHLRYGGRRLAQLASDTEEWSSIGEDELNGMVAAVAGVD